MDSSLFYLVILSPLAGFLLSGSFGLFNLAGWREDSRKPVVGWFGSIAVLIPFLVLLSMFLSMKAGDSVIVHYYDWMSVGSLSIPIAYQVDSLSMLMGLMVTGVGFLIHVYSIGYMAHDSGYWRFFTYLNLFIFAMLNLVFADNLVLLFLGWEGVGLCSYLLIGFWFQHAFANVAAIKAFVMNRIGDFAFLIGMFMIFNEIGTLQFNSINALAASINTETLFWAGFFLFIGATGKSAQIPLYTWLPDAMAGPTPVSALIHAATMVTAGVYLVARMSPFFSLSAELMGMIAIVGGITAIFAATIGMFQNDIKKILAYSTVSQLGYMFLAAGVGAFSAAIFHVFTHAFFKAALFLGSGSVIHAVHEEQDITKMGGLRKYLPQTYITFMVATFALAGFPLTAGFFSKDEIIARVFASGSIGLYVISLTGALLTAIYMMRLTSLTFGGEYRGHVKHPHESPWQMTVPLWILAAGSLLVGFLGVPAVITEHNWVGTWLGTSVIMPDGHLTHSTEWILIGIGSAVAIAGLFIGWNFYSSRLELVDRLKNQFSGLHTLIANKYFVDEWYDRLVVKPYEWLSGKVLAVTENMVLYPVLGLSGKISVSVGELIRFMQTGHVPAYVVYFTIGVVGVIGYLLFI